MAPTLSLDNFSARILPFILVLLSVVGTMSVTADPAKDREECAEQLTGLATCLPYVSGQAKAPTPDCCNGLKQVLKNKKKCLCVIIRDRNDPDLGLQINVNLALSLPSVCHAPANVSKCPELLNMDPHSPEAQVFYQLERNSTQTANSPSPTPTAGGPVSAKSKGLNSSSESVKKRLAWKVIIGSVLLLKFMQWFM